MDAARLARLAPSNAAKVTNRKGSSPFVVVCDHASNLIPEEYGTLGLAPADITRHIAWDPGALPVAQLLSKTLDAPLVESCVSRLIVDCNRPLDAPDLIWEISETTEIPGNRNLGAEERAKRIAFAHAPFHELIDSIIAERLRDGWSTWLVSIHSFTPVFKSVPRPWQVGIIHDDDKRLAGPMIEALKRTGATVGVNQPYSPADGVYYTLQRHARSRGLPCAMIEIRNDEIAEERGQSLWGGRLGEVLADLAKGSEYQGEVMAKADKFGVPHMTSRGR